MKKLFGFVVLVLLALGLAACAPAGTPTPSGLTGIVWQWTSLTDRSSGNETTTSVPDPIKYTITFNSDGTLEGKADCNTFSGTYSQQNGFSISLGAMTKAYCGENSMDSQYLQLLGTIAAGGPDGSGGLALETAGAAQRMLFQNGGAAK